jgi:branched-chain amino acid transport system substrate-binding protein
MSITTKASAFRSRGLKSTLGGIAILATGALVLAGCASDDGASADPEPTAFEDYTMNIGTLLPQTGNLAFLGPPEEAGVGYAVAEVNEYAETSGLTINVEYGDSGDTNNRAFETEVPRILATEPTAVIGAASSGTSLQFIDQVTGAGVIQFSPANTSDAFTTYDDNGLYFRTAPSDVLQGEVLGNLIAEDGHQTLGLIVLNDSYGTGLASYVSEAFEAAGGEVVAESLYNTGDATFDTQVNEVLAADPDAIALITFAEVSSILPSLFGQIDPESLYFVDGNLSNFGDEFAPGSLTGAKGTLPGLSIDTLTEFTDALDAWVAEEGLPALTEYSYAAESYDAVILLALASLASGGATDGATVAEYLQEVSGGSGDGTTCTTYAECADIILSGGTADYDGISGPVTFDEVGDPTEATIGIYQFGEDNTYAKYEG